MKIFLVTEDIDLGYHVVAAFQSKAEAKAFVTASYSKYRKKEEKRGALYIKARADYGFMVEEINVIMSNIL